MDASVGLEGRLGVPPLLNIAHALIHLPLGET